MFIGDFPCIKDSVYIDDGFSGTNFNRPGFQEMMVDIENGLVDMVVVKDMSRFGRNYLEVGLYTEIRFPEMGVRFIAVNDGVDSEREDNDFTPFRNIINVLFCFSTVFANGVKAHNIAKALVTFSPRERRLQVLFLFLCCL